MINFFRLNFEHWLWTLFGCSLLFGQGLRYSKLYLAHALLCSIFFFYLYKRETIKINLKLFGILSFFITYVAFSLVWSPNWRNGLYDLFYLCFGAASLLILTSKNVPVAVFRKSLLVVYTLNLLLSLLETFNVVRWPHSTIAVYFNIIWETKHLDLPTGFLWNPNNNALFIAMFLPWVFYFTKGFVRLGLFILATFIVWRCGSKLVLLGYIPLFFTLIIVWAFEIKKMKYVFISGLLILLLPLSYLTFQKSSTEFRSQKYAKTEKVVTLFAQNATDIVSSGLRNEQAVFDFSNYDQSLHERLVLFELLVNQSIKAPLFGNGAGSLKQFEEVKKYHHLMVLTPHFYYMEIWAKFGFLILGLYLVLLGYLMKKLVRYNKYGAISLSFFTLFNIVLPTASYFLPMWYLYSLSLKSEEL